jgi:hypothetical protein
VAGEAPIPVSLYIDLASSESLELLIRPGMKFELPAELSEERYAGTGLSGDVHARLGRVARLVLGPFEQRDVAAQFVEASVRSKQEGADGILGNGLLRRFDVILVMDEPALYLKPDRTFQDPSEETPD